MSSVRNEIGRMLMQLDSHMEVRFLENDFMMDGAEEMADRFDFRQWDLLRH